MTTDSEERTSVLAAVRDWLRGGYPQGIPQEDYIALFAVLHRRLTDYEVRKIAADLVKSGATEDGVQLEEIEEAIAKHALETPSDADIARVASRLAAGGWPLADPASH